MKKEGKGTFTNIKGGERSETPSIQEQKRV